MREGEMTFLEKLEAISRRNRSLLCVGLDPDPKLLPDGVSVFEFNRAIVTATADLVSAYKLNFAFYEALDDDLNTLKRTVEYIPRDVPVIGDAKRGDIGNTAEAYAKTIFGHFGCDATTVNPYLGADSVAPFLNYHDRGVFILCRTSNPGARDFQSLRCEEAAGTMRPLFEIVASKAEEWNKHGNVGLVVGATYPEELKLIRESHPDMPLLIPGIGAQGGDLALAVRYGVTAQGGRAIYNSSRQIIYASRGRDFAQAARCAAQALRDEINRHITDRGSPGHFALT
jgi:orotidine-5'-phosphate decarboxylase